VGFPYKLSRTPATITRHPPLLGEHTETVLRDILGYDAEAIAALCKAKATSLDTSPPKEPREFYPASSRTTQ
jgi:hypothetical protein